GVSDTLDIVIKRIEPFYALTQRRVVHSRSVREQLGKTIEKAIAQGLIKWTGSAPIEIFYEEEFRGEYFDTEVAVPVNFDHTPTVLLGEVGTLTLREIPAIESAAIYLH